MIRDIAFDHGDDPALTGRLQSYQRTALADIASCGTEACGLHEEVCTNCDVSRTVPNTCGNRSCPHCQGRERAAWVDARMNELLPCSYFHAVLTLPSEYRSLAKYFPRIIFGLLLTAACDAIHRLCLDPKHLGAEVGQLAVLHTWRRDMHLHPHVHIIITAGGWDFENNHWVDAKRFGKDHKAFLMPVDRLRAVFKRRFKHLLLKAYDDGKFTDIERAAFTELVSHDALERHIDKIAKKTWTIRVEPPFDGPATLLKYLGRYINRVAISPQRITNYDRDKGTVTYTWTTNAEPEKPQQATVSAVEFLALFAQHILPPGFQRIRFRGLWSTAHRHAKLHLVQKAFGMSASTPEGSPEVIEKPPPPIEFDPKRCQICGLGRYQRKPGIGKRPPRWERAQKLRELRLSRRTTKPCENTITA